MSSNQFNESVLNKHLTEIKQGETINIDSGDATVIIWVRPDYCDRGHFMMDIESKNQRKLAIDGADLFPRIYFLQQSLINELREWCIARKQQLISIKKEGIEP